MDKCMFYGVPKTAQEETRVYVISCEEDFDFREAEQIGDYESIKQKAEELGTVYTLECFQDELNSENVNIDNSFVYIEQPPLLNNATYLLEACKQTIECLAYNDTFDDKNNLINYINDAQKELQQAIKKTENKVI